MAGYSQKWHNEKSRTRSTKNYDRLAAIQAQLNNLGREIKKLNEKVYAAQVGCEQCKGPYYTKEFPLKEEGKTLKEAYYTNFGAPFQGWGYKAAALGFCQRNNTNPSKEKVPGSFTLPCFTNNVCFNNALADLGASNFFYLNRFTVLEDMDAYRDEGMSDIIFGEPFLREVRINAKRFEGMITIHNGNKEVTYQMVQSHLRFKHHTNEQCHKIPPLLKDLAERKEINDVGRESTIWKF
nr:hypothetical protein [Tanacetum cinerariifolium]